MSVYKLYWVGNIKAKVISRLFSSLFAIKVKDHRIRSVGHVLETKYYLHTDKLLLV